LNPIDPGGSGIIEKLLQVNSYSGAARLVLSGGPQQIPFDNFYMFQKGRIYRYYGPRIRPVNAIISNPAPGVLIDAVIGNMDPLEMIAAPTSELLLLP
jgi:hypothetical protein